MLVNATNMLLKARDGHYAVGQFNINNLEGVLLYADPEADEAVAGYLNADEGVLELRHQRWG